MRRRDEDDDGQYFRRRARTDDAERVADYLYQDESRKNYAKKIRYYPKNFEQLHWVIDKWERGAPDGPVIPYRLPELLAAPLDVPVHICEGEKDADTLARMGLVATSAPSSWQPELNRWFARRRLIYVHEDNDAHGRSHAAKVARNLAPLVGEVRIVRYTDLPETSDVTDLVQKGGTTEQLLERFVAAPVFTDEDAPQKVAAEPFAWTDPANLPRRTWHYAPSYIASYLGLTLAPGGVGKSSLVIAEMMAMVSGKPLLGITPAKPLRVWYVNLEDPMDELQRRIAATAKHYGLSPEDIEERLFVNSGRTTPMVIATEDFRSVTVNMPLIESVTQTIRDNSIDVMIVDPFVASHRLSENDNSKIDAAARAWSGIAEETGAAVMLVHHLRKTGGERGTVEDGRGASALLAAARTARVINTMTKDEAQGANIEERDRRFHFRVDVGKANMSAPADQAQWCRLVSVDLGNVEGVDWDQGDRVGVVTAFAYPKVEALVLTPADRRRILDRIKQGGPWREDQRAGDWVGKAFSAVMKLDLNSKPNKRAVMKIVADWLTHDLLVVVQRRDKGRVERSFVEIGPAAADIEPEREE